MFVFFAIQILVLYFSFVAQTENAQQDDWDSEDSGVNEAVLYTFISQLPPHLKPMDYFIRIFPVPADGHEFHGFVRIYFEVLQETRIISLHVKNLHLEWETLNVTFFPDETSVNVTNKEYNPEEEVLTLTLATAAPMGHKIRFSSCYSGLLSNGSYGLNQYFYEEDEVRKRFLVTYFPPIGARRVFPCMDEPDLKARFTLHVASRMNEFVLSNMPVQRTTNRANCSYYWTIFERSLPMSTYLVAFLISNFKSDLTVTGETTQLWSREAMRKNVGYSSSLAPKALKWFETYFGVLYPLSKLDIVALPSYPVPGMENFGLILSEEDSLTTNDKLARKEWVATVTAHEIAHQWIGNLVTPSMWSGLWLSEGFATYFAARALDEIEPDLEATYSLLREQRRTLSQDEGNRVTDLVVTKFDSIIGGSENLNIYFKGAAVVRMLNSVLGEKIFARGMKQYFNQYKFRTVSESDLYFLLDKEFSESNGTLPASLDEIMKSWSMIKGFPLITVDRLSNGMISLRQEYFEPKLPLDRLTELEPSNGTNLNRWVPVSYYTSRDSDFNTAPRVWLPPTNESKILEGISEDDRWLVLNSQQVSYLRVNYDKSLWKAIADQLLLDHHNIHILNRAHLFNDAFHLFNSGYLDAEQPLDLMQYLGMESCFFPLNEAFLQFQSIEIVMRGSIHYSLLQDFLRMIIIPQFETDFGTSHTETKRYHLVLSWACKFQIENCTKLAHSLFRQWKITNNISIFPEGAEESLLCSAIEFGSSEDWEIAYIRSFSEDTKETKFVRNALSCSRNETLMKWYMHAVSFDSRNLTHDRVTEVFDRIARSVRWNGLFWTFFNENFDALQMRFGEPLPLPFIKTPNDFVQFEKIIRKLRGNDISNFTVNHLKPAADYVDRTISQVSDWLIQRAPFEPWEEL